MQPNKDYSFFPALVAVSVIGLLFLIGFIAPFEVWGMHFKRINILSDIYHTASDEDETYAVYSDTTFTAESLRAIADTIVDEGPVSLSQSWDVSPSGFIATPENAAPIVPAGLQTDSTGQPVPAMFLPATDVVPVTQIEDFSDKGMMDAFYATLRTGHPRRAVRIAVLGDSFIEADIITSDLREQLQQAFGGEGVGFVPFASPLAKYRATVKHTFSGWRTYNVLQKKSAPAAVQDKFFVSGQACIPDEGAWTRIEGTPFRRNIQHCSVARILFTNTAASTLHVTINDSIRSQFTPEASPLPQQITLRGDIRSIEVKITSVEGFAGYGIVLEDEYGVSVDNYSIRSNSGMALFGTNGTVNSQIGKLIGYDLIILQYGLNSMSPNVMNYTPYTAQLGRIVEYVRECFPSSAILLMSVGDRSTQKEGAYNTMPAAKAMLQAQLKAAQTGKTAFWNTFEAMGGEKSMVSFVNKGWAAKDYTHINYQGGKYIATEFVRSLLYGYSQSNPKAADPLPELAPFQESGLPQPVNTLQTATPKPIQP